MAGEKLGDNYNISDTSGTGIFCGPQCFKEQRRMRIRRLRKLCGMRYGQEKPQEKQGLRRNLKREPAVKCQFPFVVLTLNPALSHQIESSLLFEALLRMPAK